MHFSQGSIDTDTEDSGSECVICMCDGRDTLILPCRHLCLCNSCADSLRYQANNCPICRAPFRALLQIRALQKNSGQPLPIAPTAAAPTDVSGLSNSSNSVLIKNAFSEHTWCCSRWLRSCVADRGPERTSAAQPPRSPPTSVQKGTTHRDGQCCSSSRGA
jgi:Zinc finger, C3HC4 type (RING finger)